jgi:surface antigen
VTLNNRVSSFVRWLRAPRALFRIAVVVGTLMIAFSAMPSTSAAQAHGLSLHWVRGLSVQQGYLCYGYANHSYHCTRHWYRTSSGRLVSTSRWVPTSGGSGGVVTTARTGGSGSSGSSGTSTVVYSAPSGISQWANPGRGSWAMSGAAGGGYGFGYCTWYPWYRNHNLAGLGMAANWANAARARGMAVGSAPVAGAAVVFQPGVQGAGGGGHVSHVEAVYGNGWFLVSEMNFYWNGGGWGRVSFRYAHAGAGVSFIYG